MFNIIVVDSLRLLYFKPGFVGECLGIGARSTVRIAKFRSGAVLSNLFLVDFFKLVHEVVSEVFVARKHSTIRKCEVLSGKQPADQNHIPKAF